MSTPNAVHTRRTPARLAGWPRFVALDLRSLASFGRTIVITFSVLIVVAAVVAPNPATVQALLALGIVLMVPASLFSTDDQAGLETLYQLLPIRKRTRVIGRYATVLFIVLAAVVLGTLAGLIDAAVTGKSVDGLGSDLGILLAAALVLQAIQLPLYFALGYQRARLLNMVLLFGAAALVFLAAHYIQFPDEEAVPLPVILAGSICFAVICYAISALVAYRAYRRREF